MKNVMMYVVLSVLFAGVVMAGEKSNSEKCDELCLMVLYETNLRHTNACIEQSTNRDYSDAEAIRCVANKALATCQKECQKRFPDNDDGS